MGDPFMQLLSLVDPNEASKEIHAARGGSVPSNVTYHWAKAVFTTNTSGDSSSSSVTTSSDITNTINKLTTYIPAVLAVMTLNALVILILVAAAAWAG